MRRALSFSGLRPTLRQYLHYSNNTSSHQSFYPGNKGIDQRDDPNILPSVLPLPKLHQNSESGYRSMEHGEYDEGPNKRVSPDIVRIVQVVCDTGFRLVGPVEGWKWWSLII